jgi:hypothetical protein
MTGLIANRAQVPESEFVGLSLMRRLCSLEASARLDELRAEI